MYRFCSIARHSTKIRTKLILASFDIPCASGTAFNGMDNLVESNSNSCIDPQNNNHHKACAGSNPVCCAIFGYCGSRGLVVDWKLTPFAL